VNVRVRSKKKAAGRKFPACRLQECARLSPHMSRVLPTSSISWVRALLDVVVHIEKVQLIRAKDSKIDFFHPFSHQFAPGTVNGFRANNAFARFSLFQRDKEKFFHKSRTS